MSMRSALLNFKYLYLILSICGQSFVGRKVASWADGSVIRWNGQIIEY